MSPKPDSDAVVGRGAFFDAAAGGLAHRVDDAHGDVHIALAVEFHVAAAAGAGDVDHLRALDQLLRHQRLLDRARGLVPAAAWGGRANPLSAR